MHMCALCPRLAVANASTFPNPTDLTLKPLPSVNPMATTCSEGASAGVSQSWTNSLPTNNGLHHASKKSVTFSSVSIGPKENSLTSTGDPIVTNLSSLPTLPSLNKTGSMPHYNNSNTVVKLGEEVKASLLNHHVTTQSLNAVVSLQNVVSSMVVSPSQHGTVLITKQQEGSAVIPKATVTDPINKPAMPLAAAAQQAVSNLLSIALTTASSLPVSARTVTSAPASVSVVPSVQPVASMGQTSAITDPNALLGKRPRQNMIKTEEVTPAHQQQQQQATLPVLVSGCFITCTKCSSTQ